MPKVTLNRIPGGGVHMRPSATIVRAFDGSRREVIGEIELPMQIGPCTFQITFQVMDILSAYSCLLGRHWIHSVGVVPSTLYQKLKFVINDKLIIVSKEEDFIVSGSLSSTYIDTAEEALETSFQALEIVNNAYVEPFQVNLYLSDSSLMMAKTMLRKGYKYGNGLGKKGTGPVFPLELVGNKRRYGLGYKPTQADKRRVFEERKEKNMARLEGRELKMGRITLCDINQSFHSSGWINTNQVEESEEESLNFGHPCSPHVQLNNWVFVNVSRVFNGNEIYVDESFENNNVNISYTNFTLPVNNAEDDYEED